MVKLKNKHKKLLSFFKFKLYKKWRKSLDFWIYNNKIYADFQGNEIPKDNEYCTCLSVVLLDSVVRADNYYRPRVFLEEWEMGLYHRKKDNEYN